jgi:hypothetical protein
VKSLKKALKEPFFSKEGCDLLTYPPATLRPILMQLTHLPPVPVAAPTYLS